MVSWQPEDSAVRMLPPRGLLSPAEKGESVRRFIIPRDKLPGVQAATACRVADICGRNDREINAAILIMTGARSTEENLPAAQETGLAR